MKNSGIHIKRSCNPSREKTVIVVGGERTGTSMVANTLVEAGIYMGSDLDPTFQNNVLSEAINEYIHSHSRSADTLKLGLIIRYYNDKYSMWGWKFPGLMTPELYKLFRNPYLIVIARDFAATAGRISASEKKNIIKSLHKTAEQQAAILKAAARSDMPTMFVSYEKALLNPEDYALALFEFLDIPMSGNALEMVKNCIVPSPEQYRAHFSKERFKYALKASSIFVEGWFFDSQRAEGCSLYSANIDGQAIVEFRDSDLMRNDVLLSGLEKADCGLYFNIPSIFWDGEMHDIEVAFFDEQRNELCSSRKKCRLGAPIARIDRVTDFEIFGWAMDPAHPENKMRVALLQDARILQSTVADIFRKDLKDAGYFEGTYGFFMKLDQPICGKNLSLAILDEPNAIVIKEALEA